MGCGVVVVGRWSGGGWAMVVGWGTRRGWVVEWWWLGGGVLEVGWWSGGLVAVCVVE